ncbi:MAG TPA: phenylalanine--tRNA ligase subunit beta [Candidatus Saccharimonadia bacterium]|jgi:phenylalanyl-tRNA synthetase beta chain
MKVSSSWIKKWLGRTMLNDHEIAEALERAGMEVEQIIESKPIDEKVIVCSVKKVIQHPNAERLKICEVAVGERQWKIVCGAPNVREGMKAALAQIGTVLPSGDRIEKAKLRGEVSEGMLCSERELEIGNDHNGILEVSSEVAEGTALCDIYPADTVIDIKTPANRFDVLSVVGLAREVAAMTTATLSGLPTPLTAKAAGEGPAVEKGAEAGRYMLARLKVNQAGHSPRDMQARLSAAGMRPISPVVDVTNYVMLELGQPLHAFDATKVQLPIDVRFARTGESLTTLDGVERKLNEKDLVIVDKRGPIALAGVMGGAETEVDASTTEILLECAIFDSALVRKAAKRHSLRTEASARYERGLPVALSPIALSRAVELFEQVAGGKMVAVTDQLNEHPEITSITLPLSRLVRLLGFGITHKEAAEALEKLQISIVSSHKNQITVSEVPWWRTDLKLPEDLVEEVVRVVGYDQVPSTIPSWRPQKVEFDRRRAKRRRVRDLMYAAGLFEVVTYSFVSAEQLRDLGLELAGHSKLKNPLSSEQAYLRSTLLPSHLSVLARNRHYAKELGFYETSNVFVKSDKTGEQPDEPLRLGVMVSRPELAYSVVRGVLDALARELNLEVRVEPANRDEFAPGRAAEVKLGSMKVGVIGQLHPERLRVLKIDGEAAYMELDLTPLIEASRPRQFAGASRFPATSRDLTVLLPERVTWQAVADELVGQRVEFVDDYRGAELPEGYKSLTLRLTLSHPERTPTETEAVELEATMLRRLERKLGAKPRD